MAKRGSRCVRHHASGKCAKFSHRRSHRGSRYSEGYMEGY